MRRNEREENEALAELRAFLAPGDTVFTLLRHVSRSGMQREIDVLVLEPRPKASSVHLPKEWKGEVVVRHISGLVAKALGWKFGDRGGVKVSGCGMDMGFHLVYQLSYALWPDGFECLGAGAGCPANDHFNGDKDYTPHLHKGSGGYALKHRWL